MAQNRLPRVSISVYLSQLTSQVTENATLLLVGHLNANRPTNGDDGVPPASSTGPTPQTGYTGSAVEFYKPYLISQDNLDPSATISAMQELGFWATYGVTTAIVVGGGDADAGVPPDDAVISGTTTTLSWDTRPTNFSRLGTTGTGVVTQATSGATGTFAGFATSGYGIIVTGVDTDTPFDTTHDITVTFTNTNASTLDAVNSDEICVMVNAALTASLASNSDATGLTPTIYIAVMPSSETGFGTIPENVLAGKIWYSAVIHPYEMATQTDYDTTYVAYVNFIKDLNLDTEADVGFYGTFGMGGIIGVTKDNSDTLYIENSPYFQANYFPYDNALNTVYQLPGQIASAAGAYIISNPAPFDGLNDVVLAGITAPDTSTEGLVKSDCQTPLGLGITPIYVNVNNEPTFCRTIVGMLTYPDTDNEATQYYDVQDWQVLFYNKQFKGIKLQSSQFKNRKLSNALLQEMRNAMIDIDKQFETANMLQDVSTYIPQYTATQGTDVHTAVLYTPIDVIPALQNIGVSIYLQNQYGTVSTSTN